MDRLVAETEAKEKNVEILEKNVQKTQKNEEISQKIEEKQENFPQIQSQKYLNSLSVSGFSGVSSGQRNKMQTAETMVMNSKTVWKSYIFENLITTMQTAKEKDDIISHLVSVDAW